MINNMLFSRSEVDVLWENELKNRAIFSYNDKVAYARILANTMLDRVTPFVDDMTYDFINDVIKVDDDLNNVSIHYYMNLRGNVSTPAYVDGDPTFFSIDFVGDEDKMPFQTYYERKSEIASYLEEKEAKIESRNKDICLKMAMSSKNK